MNIILHKGQIVDQEINTDLFNDIVKAKEFHTCVFYREVNEQLRMFMGDRDDFTLINDDNYYDYLEELI